LYIELINEPFGSTKRALFKLSVNQTSANLVSKWLLAQYYFTFVYMDSSNSPFAQASATHQYEVKEEDCPYFNGEKVHSVCSTYVLAREFEWSGRRIFLANQTPGTDALGTSVAVAHKSPAFVGTLLTITARHKESSFLKNGGLRLEVDVVAECDGRVIATGSTTQHVLSSDSIKKLFSPSN
jgi:fluoroacetyl-CoA thioesterase